MNTLIQLFQQHPYSLSIAGTWIFNNVVTAFVSAFPAPTKDSRVAYVVWFKFSNGMIGNIKRAQSTEIEKSPNWNDALDKAGQPPSMDQVNPPKP